MHLGFEHILVLWKDESSTDGKRLQEEKKEKNTNLV